MNSSPQFFSGCSIWAKILNRVTQKSQRPKKRRESQPTLNNQLYTLDGGYSPYIPYPVVHIYIYRSIPCPARNSEPPVGCLHWNLHHRTWDRHDSSTHRQHILQRCAAKKTSFSKLIGNTPTTILKLCLRKSVPPNSILKKAISYQLNLLLPVWSLKCCTCFLNPKKNTLDTKWIHLQGRHPPSLPGFQLLPG